jgi:hypothetical protein
MKSTLITLAAITFTTMAAAQTMPTIGGEVEAEYNIKEKNTEWTAGPTIGLGGLVVKPRINGEIDSGATILFTGPSVKVEAGVGTGVTFFGTVNGTDKFKYQDATVGVNYSF